jgi:IclR family acetate operon transcriptional repressor
MVASAAQRGEAPSGTLERGLSVLEFFAGVGEAAASDAVAALGISRSAAYRILGTLQRRGYLEINPASEKLRLGVRTAELGMAAVSGVDAVRLAPSYLHELVGNTLETVFLAVRDGGAVVYVYKEEGPQAIKMSSRLGSRRPLYCTALGKAYLSALSAEARRVLIGELDFQRVRDRQGRDRRGRGLFWGTGVRPSRLAGRRDQRRRTGGSDPAQGR